MASIAAPPTPARIAALDVVRLVCALWVLSWHFYFDGYHVRHYFPIRTPALESLSQYGFLGVQVFFVISGFVIPLSCRGRGLGAFLAARAIRLYPAYWICGATTLTVGVLWAPGGLGCGAACVAFNATLLNGFFDDPRFLDSSYWSLAVELEFYAFVAVLIVLRQTGRIFWLMLAWLALATAPFLGLHGAWLHALYFGGAAMWAPFFACGVMLYLVWQEGPRARYLLVLALAWVLAAFSIGNDVASFAGIQVPGHPFSRLRGIALFSAFLLVLGLISLKRLALRDSRFTRFCGGTSYPLYLLHQVVGITLLNRFRGSLPDPWLMAAVTLLVIAASALIWRWAELPVQRQLNTMLKRWRRPALEAA